MITGVWLTYNNIETIKASILKVLPILESVVVYDAGPNLEQSSDGTWDAVQSLRTLITSQGKQLHLISGMEKNHTLRLNVATSIPITEYVWIFYGSEILECNPEPTGGIGAISYLLKEKNPTAVFFRCYNITSQDKDNYYATIQLPFKQSRLYKNGLSWEEREVSKNSNLRYDMLFDRQGKSICNENGHQTYSIVYGIFSFDLYKVPSKIIGDVFPKDKLYDRTYGGRLHSRRYCSHVLAP